MTSLFLSMLYIRLAMLSINTQKLKLSINKLAKAYVIARKLNIVPLTMGIRNLKARAVKMRLELIASMFVTWLKTVSSTFQDVDFDGSL